MVKLSEEIKELGLLLFAMTLLGIALYQAVMQGLEQN